MSDTFIIFDVSRTLKVLANPGRLAVLMLLAGGGAEGPTRPAHIGEIQQTLGTAPFVLAKHLLDLRRANLIEGCGRGRDGTYKLTPRIKVTDDKLIIDASGLEITIARALSEPRPSGSGS